MQLFPKNATTQIIKFYFYYSGIFETDGEKNVGLSIKFEYTYEGETRSIEESQTLAKVDNVSILIKYKVLLYIRVAFKIIRNSISPYIDFNTFFKTILL